MDLEEILNCKSTNIPETSIQDLLSSGKKLAIFGCGQGLKTFEIFVLNKFDIKVDLYIDQNFRSDDQLNGIRAVNSENLMDVNTSEYNVIVTISHGLFKGVEQQLSGYSFASITSAFDYFEYHLAYVDRQLAYTIQNEICKYADDIRTAYSLLHDDLSKLIFKQILGIYRTGKINPVACRPLTEQYLSTDVNLQKGFSKTINCGAFDGDTVKNISSLHGKFEFLTCIEPDLENFIRLSKWLYSNGVCENLADEICLYPVAIGSETKHIRIDCAGTNSHINSKTSHTNAICVKLDDIIFRGDITFINMDIEGCELEAIKGSKRIIIKSKPDLAISIYHRPSDLWEIVLELHKICPGYRFAIRNYSGYPAETVLYATWTD